MTSAAQSTTANYGLVSSILRFLSGSMLMCDCAGWFVCAGVAAALPAIWGSRVVRIAGISLCIASFATAVGQFRAEQTTKARFHRIREKATNPQPAR